MSHYLPPDEPNLILSLVAAGMVKRDAPQAAPVAEPSLAAQLSDLLRQYRPARGFAYVSAPPEFDVLAEDLRAEFARHGMQWQPLPSVPCSSGPPL